jgi:transcriptional regulator with XRE-family HTH domain
MRITAEEKEARKNVRSAGNVHHIIGNRLRQMRIERDMSQQELGEKLGVSFQQIQKYEKGKNRIDAGRLIAIANVFGCHVEEFYA